MGGTAKRKPSTPRAVLWYGVKAVILFCLYVATAKAGLALQAVGNYAAPVWPPSGIAIAFVFLWGESFAPVIFLAAAVVNASIGAPPIVAALLGLGNAGEAYVAALLLRRVGFRPAFERVKDVVRFMITAGLLAPLVSATIGVTTLWFAGMVSAGYGPTWLTWWLGDVLGAMVVAPAILTFAALGWFRLLGWRKLEALLLALGICGFDYALFVQPSNTNFAAIFLVFAYGSFAWAAVRFGTRGATFTTLITSAMLIAGTVLKGQSGQLIVLQAFLATIAVPFLLIAAANEERERGQEEIERMNRGLKDEVASQTRAIEEAARRDEAILAGIGDGLIAVDNDANITRINPSALLLLGIAKKDVVGMRYDTVFAMTDPQGKKIPRRSRPMYQVIASGRRFDMPAIPKYFYVRPDGTRFPVAVTVTPIVLNGKTVGAVQVFRDITVEEGIERAKSEFVALASHQLRTPLTAVRWYADALADKKKTTDTDKLVAEIRRNVARMASTISTILDVSKIEVGGVSATSVAVEPKKLIQEAIQTNAVRADQKGLIITPTYAGGSESVRADPTLLKIVLENLLSNAVKYSKPGGRIDIDLRKSGGQVEISFADQGIGIGAADQKKIFTKFFRADNARLVEPDGNGLGLYLTKSYVEQMGGSIRFESTLGQGTTFFLTMPANKAAQRIASRRDRE